MSRPSAQESSDNVTWLHERPGPKPQTETTFNQPLPTGTMRTVVLSTTGVECPLTTRVLIDVSMPADQVMHVLWAATGLTSSSSGLLTRQGQDAPQEHFGLTTSWENSANRENVHGMESVQFGQLFVPETELYAELDPGRGYRARVKLESAEALGDAAAGMPGSAIRVEHDPFAIPVTLTAEQTDVILQASDGEQLTPVQQQILVELTEPIDLTPSEICQVMALTMHHGVRLGMAASDVHYLPWFVVEEPYVLAARELFRFIAASADGVQLTKAGNMPVSELRRLLVDPSTLHSIFQTSESLDVHRAQHSDVPLVHTAWQVLRDSGLISIAHPRAKLAANLDWVANATIEDVECFVEVALLRHVLDHGEINVADRMTAEMHPTMQYETAQVYADSLISSALALPEEGLMQLLDDQLEQLFELDEPREHLEFSIELLGMSPPVIRRMSVPCDANLHASIETILIMFGWELTHLWQLDLLKDNGMHETLAASFSDMDQDAPLAADLKVSNVLTPEGPQVVLIYDYGDGWQMLITPIGTRIAEPHGELLAVEGACPPEDSGGPGGYEQKLLAMRDPLEFQRQHPDFETTEVQEIAAWARANGVGQRVPEPGMYAIDEHAVPYEF
ncbi:plasmid pRiA4b ORF-3 family protein [Enteractinococcus helveticum]|nr:plasmid pRiA4b ORF-3 family protein [Enteractinococcus helveticum]